MKNGKGQVKHISDYEWASACQYIVWVTAQMGVKDVNAEAVYSFPLGKYGPEKLMSRKIKTETLLQENIEAIEDWIGEYKEDLDPYEKDIIRGIWRTMVKSKAIVTEHISRIEALAKVVPQEIEYTDLESAKDDLPF